ncbi:MAG: transporter, partial [Deltaproteobacteria bacterium]|nr:transporter [Deltaproteobacteria bacterium]
AFNLVLFDGNCRAFYQPDYQNRAYTNFLDGFVGPGFLYQTFLVYAKYDDLRIGSSKSHNDFKLSAAVSIHQFAYISTKRVLGGYWGGEILVSGTKGHLVTDAGRSDDEGIGDTFVGTFIQGDRRSFVLGNYTIPFYTRFLVGATLPTGDYDHDKDFTVGSNLITYQLYNSSTFFLTPRWAASWRIMYFFHTKNSDFGPNKDNLRPGQLFNIHFSTCYQVAKGVRLGVLGHYWRQTTDDKLNGNRLRGRELAFALGPGIFLDRVVGKCHLFWESHVLFDTKIRNRPEGNIYQTRLALVF